MRKRVFAAVLVVMMFCAALSGCSSTENSEKSEQPNAKTEVTYAGLNEFLDEFKREDISILDENPDRFAAALIAAVKSCDTTDWGSLGWEETSDYEGFFDYEAESVLFGFPADMTATVMEWDNDQINNWLHITFKTGDNLGNNDAAAKICEAMFSRFNDAEEIKVGGNEASEHELRSEWKDEELDFSCEWVANNKVGKRNEYIAVYVAKGAFEVFGEVHSYVSIYLTYELSA